MLQLHGIEINEKELAELCRRYQVTELALFGSVLRADFDPDSDIDVLVKFAPEARIGLFAFTSLQEELVALFGKKVDLVPKDGLRPFIRSTVLAEARLLYVA